MFAVWDMTKPDTENKRGLSFAVVNLTTVQVTRLPLKHKLSKTGKVCFAKPLLTEDLYIVQRKEFSVTCYKCDAYT
jgi:hypothetical protein